jgi:hypothetical protein
MKNLILGLDVSTSVTGVCVVDSDVQIDGSGSHILYIDRIEFKQCNTLWDKADRVARDLEGLLSKFPGKYRIALEEPLLGFQKGMSSAGTITTLMRFNGIVSYIARRIFVAEPEYISSSHARKLCGIKMQRTSVAGKSGKEQVFEHMSKNDLKHITWPKKKNGSPVEWSRDATDAYVIARAASLEHN